MHPDIFTPGTCLFIVLLCLTTDVPLTVKHIFEDNFNWAAFHLAEKDNLRDVEINEVNKMLSCKDESRGFFTYACERCGITKTVYFGCFVAHCEGKPFSTESFDGCCNCSNQRHNFTQAQKRKVDGRRCRCTAPLFQASGL